MFTERQALKEYVSFLREERIRISSEYWEAISRLKQLDENINIHNEPTELVAKMLEVIEKQNETINQLKALIPNVTVDKVIGKIGVVEVVEATKEVAVTTQQIEHQKDIEETAKPIKRTSTNDMRTMTYELAKHLKDKGIPVKMKQITNFLETTDYKVPNNPTQMMNQIMNYEPRIQRIGKGYYQYKL